ncbi:hypothetical protein ACFP2T_08665 [Plantactinospora solaniradicis]|uniref:Uncharacterized protein n=1 Tax=Plantactinospora solaniradicis TaxID=1723736 RepID=A0ABW1K7K8_9ACTN
MLVLVTVSMALFGYTTWSVLTTTVLDRRHDVLVNAALLGASGLTVLGWFGYAVTISI